MGAVDAHGQVDIDTGATILDSEVLEGLYSLIDTPEKFSTFVNERARLREVYQDSGVDVWQCQFV